MSEKTPTPARLEAFSDGVIAVIITVMVLEIRVPHADGFEGLRALTPGLAVYLMSFGFTGIYWLNHQHVIRRAERAGHSLQIANLGFLFCLSLLPLSTCLCRRQAAFGFRGLGVCLVTPHCRVLFHVGPPRSARDIVRSGRGY